MKIGIIGAGAIGSAFAGHFAEAGQDVLVSNSRGSDSLAALVARLGPRARAATRATAAQAELAVLAVPWDQVPSALADLPP